MNVDGYYEYACREMYRIMHSSSEQINIELSKIEQYIKDAAHDPEYYLFAGMAEYSVLSGDKSIGEYNDALGGISMFEDLIEINRD